MSPAPLEELASSLCGSLALLRATMQPLTGVKGIAVEKVTNKMVDAGLLDQK